MNLIWNIEFFFNFLMAIFSTITIREFFHTFFQETDKHFKKWIIWIAYILWQFLSILTIPVFPAWMRLLLSIGFVIIASFNFNGTLIERIIFSILFNAVWMLSEVLTGGFVLVINIHVENYEFLCSLLSKIFLFIIVTLLQKFFNNRIIRKLPWNYNAVLMLLPIGSMYIAYHIFTMSIAINSTNYTQTSLISFFALFIINILIFYVYIKLSEHYELEQKSSIFKLELELINDYMKEKESTMLELRKTKHDLKHKLLYSLELLEYKEYEKLETYMKQIIDLNVLAGITIANTDNSLIDALINYKYETARRHNIPFKINLDIPSTFSFSAPELCVILGNALDNAIEANLRGTISNPFISLKMRYDNNNLIILIENSYDGKIKKNRYGEIITRKSNKQEHGIGLQSIQNSVEKFNGYCSTEITDNTFKLKIILYSQNEGYNLTNTF